MSWWWQFRAALSVAWLAFITSYRQERAEQRLRIEMSEGARTITVHFEATTATVIECPFGQFPFPEHRTRTMLGGDTFDWTYQEEQ